MFSSTFALAPAGVLGSGLVVARPYACTAVRPSLAPAAAVAEGTRVPVAGMARRRGAENLAGFSTAVPATDLPIAAPADAMKRNPINQHDGTTPLGIHPRGRSTS